MIRIVLGGIGSGKTAMLVREIIMNKNYKCYSNILTTNIKNNVPLTQDMIIKRELIKEKKDGTPVYDYKLNVDFWKQKDKSGALNVIIDEAHIVMNPRRGMSKKSKIVMEFLALLRRVIGSTDNEYGELILITQLRRRLDVIAREMCTKVQYCKCHYLKTCKCGFKHQENNETPDKLKKCPRCGNESMRREKFVIQVLNFVNMDAYEMFEMNGIKTYYDEYYIKDIEKIFPYYDTMQWENLLSEDD